MLNKTKIKFEYLLIICLSLVFIICNQKIAQAAETGCCEISTTGVTYFKNFTAKQCADSSNTSGGDFNSGAIFHPNQKVGPDNQSCVDKEPTEIAGPRAIVPPVLSVSIPGFGKFSEIKCDEQNTDCSIPWIGEYIKAIFEYSVKIIGLLAVIVIMIGGVIWLMTGGNKEKTSQAMSLIKGGVMGIVITLSSYMLLFILNPNLTILKNININYTKKEDLNHLVMEETLNDDVVSGTIKSKGQQCFLDTFGSSAKEVEKNLVTVNILGLKRQVHKLAKDAFEKVDKDLNGKLGTYVIRSKDTGTYVWRANVNNTSKLSLHSFGIAIDVNWNTNPNYKSTKKPCEGDHPAELINAFKANGFRWGGDYRTVCDSMHFEWLGPCQK